MFIVADSHSTRTEWAIIDGPLIVERAVTDGLNPYFLSRREISHIIRLYLPEIFFRSKLDHVYFYGAGCGTEEMVTTVKSSLIAQFKTPTDVYSDLLGAARGLLGSKEGIACILSTGANSCYYDGKKIVKNVRSGGYVLGDEGSNSYLGKLLVSDVLKEIAPAELIEKFYAMYKVTPEEILDQVYTQPIPNLTLTEYSAFLAKEIKHPYCRELVYNSFMQFFKRNIAHYDYAKIPLSMVGKTCTQYYDILQAAADDFGVKIKKVASSSMKGLIKYHCRLNDTK